MEECSSESEKLIIYGDLQESEEQLIACYLVGLRFDISRVIFMQPYNTLEDVIKLALKVEALNTYRISTIGRSVAKEGFAVDSTSKNPSDAKTTPKPQVKNKVHKPHQESTPKTCFKCQGLRHIDSECPNQKVIALIEEDEAEEDVKEVVESNHVQEDEKSSLLSKSDLEIKDGSNVMPLVVVEETESEKEILQEVKPILEKFVDVMLEEISHGLPPMRDIQHQIDFIPSLVFPNKLAFIMSPKEHEELETQVDDLLDKGLVRESKSYYMVLNVLVHEKDGFWRMYVACQSINNLLLHEEVRFNIMQTVEQYEDQTTEGYQRLVFDPGGWIWFHMSKERFLMQRHSKLCLRAKKHGHGYGHGYDMAGHGDTTNFKQPGYGYSKNTT